MRTEVYSWRLSGDLKSDLEREARIREVPVSSILDVAVREWLQKSAAATPEQELQDKLHAAAAKSLGVLAGGNPHRSETVRASVRERLRRRNGR